MAKRICIYSDNTAVVELGKEKHVIGANSYSQVREDALVFAEQRSYKPVEDEPAPSGLVEPSRPAPDPEYSKTQAVADKRVIGAVDPPPLLSDMPSVPHPSTATAFETEGQGRAKRPILKNILTCLAIISLIAVTAVTTCILTSRKAEPVVETRIVKQTVNSTQLAGANLFSCRATDTGKGVTCSGLNDIGQLGSADTNQHTFNLLENKPITAIATGRSSACAASRAQVYCWGDNSSGIVKKEVNQTQPPTKVIDAPDNVVALTVGASHACAATKNSVYCWGDTSKGQIEKTGGTLVPKIVLNLKNDSAKYLTSSGYVTWLETESGKVWAWGNNSMEEIPGKPKTDHVSPTKVS